MEQQPDDGVEEPLVNYRGDGGDAERRGVPHQYCLKRAGSQDVDIEKSTNLRFLDDQEKDDDWTCEGLTQSRNDIAIKFTRVLGASGAWEKDLRLDATRCIGDLKKDLETMVNIQPYFQSWEHAGRVLENDKTLFHYGIMDGNVITVRKVDYVRE